MRRATVKHDVSKDGYNASIAVLQDDSILIAWRKTGGLLTIDLYTPQLKYVRTVLSKFKFEGPSYGASQNSRLGRLHSLIRTIYMFSVKHSHINYT